MILSYLAGALTWVLRPRSRFAVDQPGGSPGCWAHASSGPGSASAGGSPRRRAPTCCPPLPPPAAPTSSQGHRVWSVGTGALGRAVSERRTDAGLCFTEDGQQFPLLQRHMEKEN